MVIMMSFCSIWIAKSYVLYQLYFYTKSYADNEEV